MKKVKVLFVDASIKPQNNWKATPAVFNGDESARLLQATIDEMEIDGYELMSTNICSGPQGLSTGTMLFFKLIESEQ